MTGERRALIEQAIEELSKAGLPAKEKLELLHAILEETKMSSMLRAIVAAQTDSVDAAKVSREGTAGSAEAGSAQTDSVDAKVSSLISRALILLPLQEEEAVIKTSSETLPQVEMEVRNALNEKFMKSPAFMLLLMVVGVGATLFTFGLYSLSSDVKSAHQIVGEFEKKLDDEKADIVKNERELRTRMDTEIDNAVAKVKEFQTNTLKAVSEQFALSSKEVDQKKRDTILDMDQKKKDALQSIADQVSEVKPHIVQAGKVSVESLENTRDTELVEFRKRADEILAELSQPAIKTVLGRAYWFIVGALIAAVVSSVFCFLTWWPGRK